MNFLVALRVPRLMPHESDFVDESRHVRAYEALMDPLAVIMVHHVLLEMRFVTEDLPAVRTGDFIHHVSVADVILEDALRWISFVASVAGEHFRDLRVLQLDVPTAVAKRMKMMLLMEENNKKNRNRGWNLPDGRVSLAAELTHDVRLFPRRFHVVGGENVFLRLFLRLVEHLVNGELVNGCESLSGSENKVEGSFKHEFLTF